MNSDLIRKLLREFDKTTQHVVLLHFLDELNQSEIAKRLRVSRRTVNRRLARFYSRSRGILEEWASTPGVGT